MAFSVVNSEIRWAESVPSQTHLALLIQNGPAWAKLALKTLGPIWLLEPIWLFPFYSVRRLEDWPFFCIPFLQAVVNKRGQ